MGLFHTILIWIGEYRMTSSLSRYLLFPASLILFAVSCGAGEEPAPSADESPVQGYLNGLPALIDLGSNSCVPCQMMEGELERLENVTAGQLDVQVIDVNRNGQAARDFGIRVIPTQVFLSESGEELFRHEGYMSFDDMMARWLTLGYTFE
jgi:thioredoxin 1